MKKLFTTLFVVAAFCANAQFGGVWQSHFKSKSVALPLTSCGDWSASCTYSSCLPLYFYSNTPAIFTNTDGSYMTATAVFGSKAVMYTIDNWNNDEIASVVDFSTDPAAVVAILTNTTGTSVSMGSSYYEPSSATIISDVYVGTYPTWIRTWYFHTTNGQPLAVLTNDVYSGNSSDEVEWIPYIGNPGKVFAFSHWDNKIFTIDVANTNVISTNTFPGVAGESFTDVVVYHCASNCFVALYATNGNESFPKLLTTDLTLITNLPASVDLWGQLFEYVKSTQSVYSWGRYGFATPYTRIHKLDIATGALLSTNDFAGEAYGVGPYIFGYNPEWDSLMFAFSDNQGLDWALITPDTWSTNAWLPHTNSDNNFWYSASVGSSGSVFVQGNQLTKAQGYFWSSHK